MNVGMNVTYELDTVPLLPTVAEAAWSIILILSIFTVNGSVLWIVGVSKELWKPRHLWMACLCTTDLFVGIHTIIGLLPLVMTESRTLCVVYKSTIGLPYVINMLLLTLLSLDRFIAVRCPLFYSAHVSNKHVLIGFLLVCLGGTFLVLLAVSFGLQDTICRAQIIQLVYLTILLTICSVLTLLFNTSVLRIAKKQLNEIYQNESRFTNGPKLSVVCTNCGFKNETYMTHPLLAPTPDEKLQLGNGQMNVEWGLSPEEKSLVFPRHSVCDDDTIESGLSVHAGDAMANESSFIRSYQEEATPLMSRTLSLPNIVPTLDEQNDSSILIQVPHLENQIGGQGGGEKGASTNGIDIPPTMENGLLPRSRSLGVCRNHKVLYPGKSRLHLFRSLNFSRSNIFHVKRLFPSIRFARTVLLILIPMWIFMLPLVSIIPLYRECTEGNMTLDCNVIETLWRYLEGIHMRSILPLQAIIDTLIYLFGSREFKQAVKTFVRKQKSKF